MTPDPRPADVRVTSALLAAGVVAGLVLTAVSYTLTFTRPGFDPARHANSMLALGDWGWVQSVDFVVCGLLLIAFGAGVWRVAAGIRSGRIAAVCVALYGLLAGVVAGLNPTDPGSGFPPGSRSVGEPSTSATVHGVAGGLGFLAMTCGCFELARYFARSGDRVWAVMSATIGVAVLTVLSYMASAQTETFDYVPTWVVGTLLWLYVAGVAARLLRSHRNAHVGAQ
ncbi:DUF998 domain-containing protein [Mycolicibacterium alvei]|uniref:DUF998 domain-containing protein n=1 Tax=Mycolicibacterium alvei TaxID=67081 RepID=A0A6N4UMA7_9MYCO|nr:DUF998 domain-containing protein [Mycolicibacterium alvei]MCV7000596.1 DUF998 domain-containing protein [Mycolicibacterium alvei]BBX25518.1 hypothetical protein MALV_06430 [Mycolicibacterium alvei]